MPNQIHGILILNNLEISPDENDPKDLKGNAPKENDPEENDLKGIVQTLHATSPQKSQNPQKFQNPQNS